jgi:cyclophilin family peptidyl-prolyl cis-trans isomerase
MSARSMRGSRSSGRNWARYGIPAFVAVLLVALTVFYIFSMAPPRSSTSSNSSSATSAAPIYAKLDTSLGVIEIELYNASAPKTVTNFVHLAQSGFYNNLVWHRVVKGFVIQTGDPSTRNGEGNKTAWGQKGSVQTVPLEIDAKLHNYAGYVGMARTSDPNSGSSQFYINLSNSSQNTALDGQYTVFGKVISGMDVALAIGNVPVDTSNDQPLSNVFLISVTLQPSR